MKLQLALDVLHTDEALRLAEATREHVDIFEIGTPLIKHEGIRVIKAFRDRFPDRELLVDLKTMDVGEYETGFCFEAGADLVTVLGVADNRTVLGTMESARRYGGRIVADLINVPDVVSRARALEGLGVDMLAVHTGIDQQHGGRTPFDDLRQVIRAVGISVLVAGGIDLACIDAVVAEGPAVVVVGAGITSAEDPWGAAAGMKAKLR